MTTAMPNDTEIRTTFLIVYIPIETVEGIRESENSACASQRAEGGSVNETGYEILCLH